MVTTETLKDITLFTREEKMKVIRERIAHDHSMASNYLSAPVDADFKIINNIIEKIVDKVTHITELPMFNRTTIEDGRVMMQSCRVDTIDVTSPHIENPYDFMKGPKKLTFYSIVENKPGVYYLRVMVEDDRMAWREEVLTELLKEENNGASSTKWMKP